jgi:hypothetical protein
VLNPCELRGKTTAWYITLMFPYNLGTSFYVGGCRIPITYELNGDSFYKIRGTELSLVAINLNEQIF